MIKFTKSFPTDIEVSSGQQKRFNEPVIYLKCLLKHKAICFCFDNSLPFSTNLVTKKTLTQALSCEFWKFFSKQFFSRIISLGDCSSTHLCSYFFSFSSVTRKTITETRAYSLEPSVEKIKIERIVKTHLHSLYG